MCNVEIDGDRLTLRPTPGTLFGHFIVIALGIASLVYGVREFARDGATNEFWVFTPAGLFVITAGALWCRASMRPIVLDRKADRAGSYAEPLSSAVKVVVESVSLSEDTAYVAEIVFPKGRFRLKRSGWSLATHPSEADRLAKKVAEFLGIPAEPYFSPDLPVIHLFGRPRQEVKPPQSQSDGV
jgi:hypothetical protein